LILAASFVAKLASIIPRKTRELFAPALPCDPVFLKKIEVASDRHDVILSTSSSLVVVVLPLLTNQNLSTNKRNLTSNTKLTSYPN